MPDSSPSVGSNVAILVADGPAITVQSGDTTTPLDKERAEVLDALRAVCSSNGGSVKVSSDSGTVCTFETSALALGCAKLLQAEATKRESVVARRFRFALHLGDFEGGGLKTAAAILAETKPGMISFSRAFHDEVRASLPQGTLYLGNKVLKGIHEPVMLWQIAPTPAATSSTGNLHQAKAPSKDPTEVSGKRFVLGSGLVLVLVAGGLFFYGKSLTPAQKKALASPPTPPISSKGQQPPPPSASQPINQQFDTREIAEMRLKYNFSGLATLASQNPSLKGQQGHYEALVEFRTWFETTLKTIPQDNPVIATMDLGRGPISMKVYNLGGSTIADYGGGSFPFEPQSQPPANWLAVARVLANGPNTPPSAKVGLAEFAREYGAS